MQSSARQHIGLIGVRSLSAQEQKRRVRGNTRALIWSTALLIAIARWCECTQHRHVLEHCNFIVLAVGSVHKLASFLEMKKFGFIRGSMLNLQPAPVW